jgi:hypothetical protein
VSITNPRTDLPACCPSRARGGTSVPYFRKDRRLLGKLSRCAADALKTLFRAASKDPTAVPGIIIAIQTYGDLVNFHSKMHPVLKRNFEVFSACDWLAALTAHIPNAGEHLVRYACAGRRTGDGHHRTAQAGGESEEGRRPAPLGRVRGEGRALAACPLQGRGPSLRTKQRERRRARVFCAAEYGWYSNVNRGKRRKAQGEEPSRIAELSEVAPSAAKRAWARLIKQVYEVDPLVCPRCGGAMRTARDHRGDPDPPPLVARRGPQPACGGVRGAVLAAAGRRRITSSPPRPTRSRAEGTTARP